MVEKRQEVIFENGVRYRLLGDPDEARLYMRHARMTYDNLDMRNDPLIVDFAHSHHMTSTGASISATRNGHLQEVVIEAYAPARAGLVKKKEDRKKVGRRYVPAFHTYNSAKVFIGLTLCTSGKWGPPYRFIRCGIDDILEFEDGQWNTSANAVRPDPEVYKPKRLASYLYGNTEETFHDMPAAHEYCSDAPSIGNLQYYFIWDSEGKTKVCVVTGYDDFGAEIGYQYVYGDFAYRDIIKSTDDSASLLVVMVDFSTPNESLPYLLKEPNILEQVEYGVIDLFEGSLEIVPIDDFYWCPIIEGWFDDSVIDLQAYAGRSFYMGIDPLYETLHDYYGNQGFFEERKFNANFFESDITWGTFVGTTSKDGFVLFANSRQDTYLSRTCSMNDIINLNCPWVGNTTITSREEIIVFGKRYTISSFGSYIWESGNNYTYYFYPRIYSTDKDTPDIALASLIRADYKNYEYLCFRDGVEQYNDPVATFPYNSTTKLHTLNAEVGGVNLYGNGKFSLVRIDDRSFEDIE